MERFNLKKLSEPKKNKPWFDEGCSKLLDQRKQAKLQWLQDPSEINGDNLNHIKREASRHFRNKKRECLKGKIDSILGPTRSPVLWALVPRSSLV
jgi:hypothetical protein